jgi:hypothetical protein
MVCVPSSTFLCVASSTSNAGTTVPAGEVVILSVPPVILSTRSANILKASCAVELAGQLDCMLSVRVCAAAGAARPRAAATALATSAPDQRRFLVLFAGAKTDSTFIVTSLG